jgi:hypothetical protein
VLEAQYAVIAVHCPCGDATHATLTGYNETEIACPCGRRWRVQMTLEDITETERGRTAGPTGW